MKVKTFYGYISEDIDKVDNFCNKDNIRVIETKSEILKYKDDIFYLIVVHYREV